MRLECCWPFPIRFHQIPIDLHRIIECFYLRTCIRTQAQTQTRGSQPCHAAMLSPHPQNVPLYRRYSAAPQETEAPRWDFRHMYVGPTARGTGRHLSSSSPPTGPPCTRLPWGAPSCLQGDPGEGTLCLGHQRRQHIEASAWDRWVAETWAVYGWQTSMNGLTKTFSLGRAPPSTREAVDELETFQVEPHEALELLVLAVKVIWLRFLGEFWEKNRVCEVNELWH